MTDTKNTAQVPTFSCDGGHMPVIGFGTFQIEGDDCRKAVKMALESGYRHIDTARMYKNEKEVGQGIKDAPVSREDIFLTTKLQMGELDPAGVRTSCENSLRDLDTDYLNLLLIHWPETSVPLTDTLGAMAKLKKEGKIRHIGVSNFTVAWMNEAVNATSEHIFCNQIEYHPYLNQDPPIDVCQQHGTGIVAYSPLARGKVLQDRTLAEIGRKYGKNPAQVALRWLIEQKDVIAIPKGSSPDHIRSNFDIFDFSLDAEDFASIQQRQTNGRLIDPDFAPKWDT